MKFAITFTAVTLLLLAPIMFGCVPGLQATKPSTGQAGPSSAKEPVNASGGTDKTADSKLPPPPPNYKPSDTGDKEARFEGSDDLSLREEINQSALDFAKNIPHVRHIKTCFSKLYGPWYLILYIDQGKRVALQQYSWNPKTKEWEIQFVQKEIPRDQLQFHVKGEVGDEKCSVLK
jgi:hypothetical protein